ncbi:MAG: hypothetical protein U0736_19345 [Gemmataceae bacterium]
MNAAVCASYPPRLYLRTPAGATRSRWPTRALAGVQARASGGARVEEANTCSTC